MPFLQRYSAAFDVLRTVSRILLFALGALGFVVVVGAAAALATHWWWF